jgi:MoxR-like ATPase
MHDLVDSAAALRAAVADAGRGLVERETLVELVALAAVAGEHLLVIGPPGTAKSEAVRRVAKNLDARYFEYLLGRFTEPSEVFGAIDLRKLREGTIETETAGMLPEADVAFLDEVFLGSTAILNTLLGLLNERTFVRGHTRKACPLRVCVGASNALPHDEQLAAFADRFLLRIFLEPVADPALEKLLEGGWGISAQSEGRRATMAQLDQLGNAARAADLAQVRPLLAQAVRKLRGVGIALSDRRAVKLQRLVAASAVLAGRAAPTAADLWPIVFAVPTLEAQRTARTVLRELLAESENSALPAAAEEASRGPLARAGRIAASGREALSARPAEGARDGWRLKLEGVLREIDATFAVESMPKDLAEVRAVVSAALKESQAA